MNFPKKDQQQNNRSFTGLDRIRRSIRRQGLLAVATVLLTGALIFAMTSAWYTNVAQTSGLTFTTQQWGFQDGKIVVTDQPIAAFPGTNGVVSMEITNNATTLTSVGVNVNTQLLSEEMKKRLFFYVEETRKENNETVDRTYVGASGRYFYTLLPGERIYMSDMEYNTAPLKWEWVYDMLGYYVYGQGNSDGSVTVNSYLRPIEYDYTQATFETTASEESQNKQVGRLLTVDGTTTAGEFLQKISQTDGYPGQIDPTRVTAYGYYPVEVAADGSGVWAYLCTYSEVEQGIAYDSALGSNQENTGFTVTINFTAQSESSVETRVSTAEGLQDALDAQDSDVILLSEDLILTKPLSIPAGMQAVIDLNGKTLTAAMTENSEKIFIKAFTDARLTILNGTVQGTGTESGLVAIGSQVTMSNVVLENLNRGVEIMDFKGTGDSLVRMQGCTVKAQDVGVMIEGNGEASTGVTRVILDHCAIDGKYAAISGQGTDKPGEQLWGTDVQLNNCVLNANSHDSWAGIYQPQRDSTLTINGGSVHGYTGVVVKGGSVTIRDAEIYGYGAAKPAAAAAGGWTDTGDGVYIEASYDWKASVEIKGEKTKVSSANARAVEVFVAKGKGPGSLRIYDGTFLNNGSEMDVSAYKIGG